MQNILTIFTWKQLLRSNRDEQTIVQAVQEKLCFFHNSLQPLPRLHRCQTPSKLSTIRVYSHSYWLVIFCTTNCSRVLGRERWQTFENSWKKTQYFMNNHESRVKHGIFTVCFDTYLHHGLYNKKMVFWCKLS